MATTESMGSAARVMEATPESVEAGAVGTKMYRVFAYFGLFSVMASQLFGFRFSREAPWTNYGINLLLYGAFAIPHLIMTRGWFKRLTWGNPLGSPAERRVYIIVTNLTWLAVLWAHFPVPGFSFTFPEEVRFAATIGFLFCFLGFFEGSSFAALDGFLGVPGAAASHSHGPETPLFTDGPYAAVRHPMYSWALLAGVCSLVIHPSSAQMFWLILLGGTFVLFIPIEEAQLLVARREEYERYMARTPYRLFRGIW